MSNDKQLLEQHKRRAAIVKRAVNRHRQGMPDVAPSDAPTAPSMPANATAVTSGLPFSN